jgi:L-arabinose isomerase
VSANEFEVWFLTGSQGLYGDEVLRQVAEQAGDVVRQLEGSGDLPLRVVQKPVLTSAAAIHDTCLAATASPTCVGVITWMHTFSPAKAWIAGLNALGKPLLHLHTQANLSLPWHEIDMHFMNLNQAAHGDREFAFLETRMRIRRKTVVGHCSQPETRTRVASWMRAARGWHEANNLRLVRFGDNMRDVAVTEGDKVEAQIRFGMSVNTYGVNDLVRVVDNIGDTEVNSLVKQYDAAYDVQRGLRADGEQRESLRYAARIEAGLRQFLENGEFNALTTNFEDLGGLRQLPGLAVQRLMADGYGFAGEGDWKTASLVRILKVMGDGLPGGTSFMEDYTYHFGPGRPRTLGAHMLEVCPSLTKAMPSCEVHPLSIGGREDPVRLVFTADSGPGFVVGLLDLGDRFRLVANDITIVEPDEPLPNLPVARAVWEPAPSLATSAEAWMTAGGPHHTALTTQISMETLVDFATIAGVELVHIDAATTVDQLVKELRWDQLYYRLAQPL